MDLLPSLRARSAWRGGVGGGGCLDRFGACFGKRICGATPTPNPSARALLVAPPPRRGGRGVERASDVTAYGSRLGRRWWLIKLSTNSPNDFARRAVRACVSCANCPSCHCAAGVRYCPKPQISSIFRVSRTHKRGASRSSGTLGAGCGGRFGGALTNEAMSGRRSRVVLAPRRWR